MAPCARRKRYLTLVIMGLVGGGPEALTAQALHGLPWRTRDHPPER